MKTKLDPEGLGIILLGPFLQEFFPEQVISVALLLWSGVYLTCLLRVIKPFYQYHQDSFKMRCIYLARMTSK